MILKKLKTSPRKLFEDIEFHNGLNIIFAHKASDENSKQLLLDDSTQSLHAVGKSTLLDFISFALLSDFEKSLPRLNNAYHKQILHGISVTLEFSVNGVDYYIKRSFDNPNSKIYFGQLNRGKPYTSGKLQSELFNLIFHRNDYSGIINNHWYFKLLSFFIKIKKRDDLFSDPVEFSKNLNELEIIPLNLFLLNIDNTIPFNYKEINDTITKLNNSLNELQKFAMEKNKTKDILSIENKRVGLKNNVIKITSRISKFTLAEEYAELQAKADSITAELKNLWFHNAVDQKKLNEIETYNSITPPEMYENVSNIASLYNEVVPLLGDNVKKSLDEVINFRKALYRSRKEFVLAEKGRLNNSIFNRNRLIEDLEKQRQNIFEQLSSQKALDDLTRSYSKLATVQMELAEIETSLKAIDSKKEEIASKFLELDSLQKKIDDYIDSIKIQLKAFHSLLQSVYSQLFLDSHEVNLFSLSITEAKAKFKLSVLDGTIIDSTGINQVRTLIYDISVLVNIIIKNLNAPRFIIHDGIFENLDKSHFFAFIKYIDELLANNIDFQYILTLNDHDFLYEDPNFKEEKILTNSIIKLTPKKTLLGKEF